MTFSSILAETEERASWFVGEIGKPDILVVSGTPPRIEEFRARCISPSCEINSQELGSLRPDRPTVLFLAR